MRFILVPAFFLLLISCSTQTASEKEYSDAEYEKSYEQKSQGLEKILGKPADLVGHAIIPFEVGGAVDMYYYPNGIKGTGFATMELIQPDGTGPVPNKDGTYELVAFTRHDYTTDSAKSNPFNLVERRACGIFTAIGTYSFENKIEPGETMEIPEDDKTICLLFDEYKPNNQEFMIGNKKHGLLLVVEVFRNEMEYAMSYGAPALIEKLRVEGYYPYSDLDRESVVK